MKSIFAKTKRVYCVAVLFWVTMFVISAFFVDPSTGELKIDLYIFHFLMFLVSLVVLYFAFGWLKKRNLIENATFTTFLTVNIGLDFAILIPFFGVSLGEWLTLILPSYILGTAITYKLYKK